MIDMKTKNVVDYASLACVYVTFSTVCVRERICTCVSMCVCLGVGLHPLETIYKRTLSITYR